MNDQFIVLSDIHANLSALEAVIKDFEIKYPEIETVVMLGDLINYGMRPNEVISKMKELELKYQIPIKLLGNHEKALFDGDTSHFSTDRGRAVLDYTRSIISEDSINFLQTLTNQGYVTIEIAGKKVLFVHGSIQDPFWGKMSESTIGDDRYCQYDYVISGHSHIPHLIEKFYIAERPEFRNKKRTIFLNPGSVGQPRNHNPRAQYIYIDISSEIYHFNSVSYDIEAERSLYTDNIDKFYSDRLINGI